MKQLGKYDLFEELGRGSMGVIYRARDRVLDREVALKIFTGGGLDDPELKERFYREARAGARLNHPNIVRVYDFGEEGSLAFIAMELLKGDDLKSYIGGKLEAGLATRIEWMTQVCDALQHAHSKQIIHRDIKPGNIFIHEDGKVRILDFGVARVQSSSLTIVGAVLGTPRYMAPEQILGQPCDVASEVFSAGILAFELISRKHPFEGDPLPKRIVQYPPHSLREIDPGLPEELEAALAKALEKDPEKRYLSADEFGKALREVAGRLAGLERRSSPPPVQAAVIEPEAPPPPLVQAAAIEPEAPPPPPVQAAVIEPEAPPPPLVQAAAIEPEAPLPPPVQAVAIEPEAPPPVQAASIQANPRPAAPAVVLPAAPQPAADPPTKRATQRPVPIPPRASPPPPGSPLPSLGPYDATRVFVPGEVSPLIPAFSRAATPEPSPALAPPPAPEPIQPEAVIAAPEPRRKATAAGRKRQAFIAVLAGAGAVIAVLAAVLLYTRSINVQQLPSVGTAEVSTEQADVHASAAQESEVIVRLRQGEKVNLMEAPRGRNQGWVNVQYVAERRVYRAGFMRVGELGRWSSTRADVGWTLLQAFAPGPGASVVEWNAYLGGLNAFIARFGGNPEALQAHAEIARVSVDLAQSAMANRQSGEKYLDAARRSLEAASSEPELAGKLEPIRQRLAQIAAGK